LPLIRLGLDSPTHSLVDAAIKCLPVILPVLDFSTVKNEVFPPIASTFSRTSSLAIKVRCLEAFTVLCGGTTGDDAASEDGLSGISAVKKPTTVKSSILDKYTIQEKLAPSLKAIKTKEPAVMMAALKVFGQIGTIADTEFLALEVLPILWTFSLGPLLSLRQFEEYMTVIKRLSSKIECEQMKKLRELSSGTEATGFQSGLGSSLSMSNDLMQSDVDTTRNNFERLVLGRESTTPGSQGLDPWQELASQAPAPQNSTQKKAAGAFSWSSVSRGDPQSNLNARSVTPDYNMSSFPSLEPVARQRSPMVAQTAPALQPSSSTAWSLPASSNMQHNMQGNGTGNMTGLTMGALTGMKSPNNPVSGRSSQQSSNYSAFTIPPPPSAPNMAASFASSGGSTPVGKASLVGNPPAPANSLNPKSTSMQTTQKQGLDKYESLL
jgi:SCY1-like protein 2